MIMNSNADVLKKYREKKRKSASEKANPTIEGKLLERVRKVREAENLKSTKAAVELLLEMGLNAYHEEANDAASPGQPQLHKTG